MRPIYSRQPAVCVGPINSEHLSPNFVESALFVLLCAFVVSQCYLVPLAVVGPSWAVWPDLPDLVIAGMALMLPWRRSSRMSQEARQFASIGWLVIALWTTSFFIVTLYALPRIGLSPFSGDLSKARGAGIAELYRMLQCQLVLLSTVSIPWTVKRSAIIGRMSAILWFVTVAFVLLTFTGIASTKLLSHGLPADLGISGPWYVYITGLVDPGVGAVSYSHAYTGMQLILAAGLYLYTNRLQTATVVPTLFLLLFCIFVSGSRASLIAALPLMIPLMGMAVRRSILGTTVVMLASVIVITIALPRFEQAHGEIFSRQESISSSLDEDGFSGRTLIWQDRASFVASDPNRWLLGAGVGSALTLGNNAHMQFLQMLVETGLFGLIAFFVVEAALSAALWRRGPEARILFWTNASLLVTCFSQETLYPVAAFPSFLPLYVFAMAAGLLGVAGRPQSIQRSKLSFPVFAASTRRLGVNLPQEV